jgi:hypothetical protein
MRTLRLTSPNEHGPDVLAAQQLLAHNMHGITAYRGVADGVYGPLTAQAAYRAKYWLGYPRPDQLCGAQLLRYLSGALAPTPGMVVRAAERHKPTPGPTLQERIVAIAQRELAAGHHEEPLGSNFTVYGDWYMRRHYSIGWCCIFASYDCAEAGSKAIVRGSKYHWSETWKADALAGRNHMTIATHPVPGDIGLIDWEGNKVTDHVVVLTSSVGLNGGPHAASPGALHTFRSIGGNEGAGVIRGDHYDVHAWFVHVGV